MASTLDTTTAFGRVPSSCDCDLVGETEEVLSSGEMSSS